MEHACFQSNNGSSINHVLYLKGELNTYCMPKSILCSDYIYGCLLILLYHRIKFQVLLAL